MVHMDRTLLRHAFGMDGLVLHQPAPERSSTSSRVSRISRSASFFLLSLLFAVSITSASAMEADFGADLNATEEDGYCKGRREEYSCCENGKGGLILPLIPYEHTWSRSTRGFLYLIALLWSFLGVSVLSDVFMAGIERITNGTYMKKVKTKDRNGNEVWTTVEETTWNPSVANLTLMALGSSTPEILLSAIEISGAGFFAGDLGPGTVVGSASFNLYVIVGLCMAALPEGETRRIEGWTVHVITAIHSLLVYVWLVVIVSFHTPDVVDVSEALITFLGMPWLVALVYAADKNWFRTEKKSYAELQELGGAGEEMKRVPSEEKKKPTSYMSYRRQITTFGRHGSEKQLGARDEGRDEGLTAFDRAIRESESITTHSVLHWEAAGYAFLETSGEAKMVIIRCGRADTEVQVRYYTRDGTGRAGQTYEEKDGIVTFEPDEVEKTVFVPLVHDYEWNPDRTFHVLLEPCHRDGRVDGRSNMTTVTVIDTDMAGAFAWSAANNQVWLSSDSHAFLLVERRRNLDAVSYSRIETRDATAEAGTHYHAVATTLKWKPSEHAKQVKIRLKPFSEPKNDNPEDKSVRFYVDVKEELHDEGGGVVEAGEAEEVHTADVRVVYNPQNEEEEGGDEFDVGDEEEPTWGQQFKQAVSVNGGGDVDEATVTDCVMHVLCLFWKLMAAFVPPPSVGGGWGAFFVALFLIGVVTAVIGDLASIFGCLMGLEDAVTAITIVALGTSLPDTFASMLATRSDETADNAIGNVTGSNSVNVFLGLGFPWLMAAVYWSMVGPTEEWRRRFGGWQLYHQYEESGAFVVQGGTLGFSVSLFSFLTCFAFLFLTLRRKYFGAEIGGSKTLNYVSCGVFVSLWLIFILVSSLQSDANVIQIIDQRVLPHQFVVEDIKNHAEMAIAIKDMHVRGAGLIGAAAGFGMLLAAVCAPSHSVERFMEFVEEAGRQLEATRPTAVNLRHAVQRQLAAIKAASGEVQARVQATRTTAQTIADEDAAWCEAIGRHGRGLIEAISARKGPEQVVNVLTHCNAGWLAFVDFGSALAPIYAAHDAGIKVHVYVDETRPRNQGASLTAWELGKHGVPHTLIADNTGGHLMQHGMVDMVITGADRVLRTGDVCNKIGTYLKALAASDNKIPMYVALPSTTLDWEGRDGLKDITIEARGSREVTHIQGLLDSSVVEVLLCPPDTPALNFAFDVTPNRLVTKLITERGVCDASEEALLAVFPERA